MKPNFGRAAVSCNKSRAAVSSNKPDKQRQKENAEQAAGI
jgi:hypothetical protein